MENNIQEFRDAVKMAFRYSIPPKANGPQLYGYLNQILEENLTKFHILHVKALAVNAIENTTDFRVSLFIAAAGLTTYGRKDVIPFVLQDIPKIGRVNYLVRIAYDLLPLPDKMTESYNKTEILDWLETHYEQLTWDEEKEVFYLSEEA